MDDKSMGSDTRPKRTAQVLRWQAEQIAQVNEAQLLTGLAALSPDEIRLSLHELCVHKIELEMQNEELRRAQLDLDATRARYFDLYELAPIGYCTLSEVGLIVEANLTLANLLGVARDALVMQPITRFIYQEDQDTYYQLRKQLSVPGDLLTCELRMRKNDGTHIWCHLAGTAVINFDGKPVLRVVLSDISELVRLKKQSLQAQKMQAVGQFTGKIAHDFNNILASILGYTDLALERIPPDHEAKLADYLNAVKQGGERGVDLIAKLLQFSRGGKSKNLMQSVAIAPLISEAVNLLRPLLPSTIKVVQKIEPALPNLMIDPAHVHQMIMNLCINSRDVLGQSGRIEIGLRKTATLKAVCTSCHQMIQGEFVELWVNDNGCGIEPANLEHIFEPFFSTKDAGKGTGLGLSTVHGLVHGYDGHIVVTSTAATGTMIRLLLPLAVASSTPTPIVSTPVTPAAADNGKMIMVVDDELPILLLMNEVLKNDGYQVTTFIDSQAALEDFRADPTRYAALVTDYSMPGLNGIELTQAILALRPNLPVILCSGYANWIDVAAGEAIGVRRFYAKPIKNKTLLDALAQLLTVKH